MRLPVEVRALIRSHTRPVATLALVALLLAQFAAGLHAIKHYGQRSDAASNAPHVLLCLDCAAFAPLAAAHGGAATSLFSAFVGADVVPVQLDVGADGRRSHARFQARAPPR